MSAARRQFGYPASRLPSMGSEHEELIDAFARNDARAAREQMRVHIQHSIDELMPRLANGFQIVRADEEGENTGRFKAAIEKPREPTHRASRMQRSAASAA